MIRRAALMHSKHRDTFGLAGIELGGEANRIIKVRLARQWKRKDINAIPAEIKHLHKRVKWDMTYVDQLVGEHLIDGMRTRGIPTKTITIQKNLKDPKKLVSVKVMDRIEMVQWMLESGANRAIEFPTNPSPDMRTLEQQLNVYYEHRTEQGGIDYFAPGEEHDDLVLALLVVCFATRLNIGRVGTRIVCGPLPVKRASQIPQEEFFF